MDAYLEECFHSDELLFDTFKNMSGEMNHQIAGCAVTEIFGMYQQELPKRRNGIGEGGNTQFVMEYDLLDNMIRMASYLTAAMVVKMDGERRG